MLWWDWNTRQRLVLFAAMFGIAGIPWVLLGLPHEWGAFLGTTAFLAILQMVSWLLFVGLKTGRMPSAYGRSELRAESPTWFWTIGAAYAGLLLFSLWIIGSVWLDF